MTMNGGFEDIPETGAIFTLGRSKFADNVASCFWLKNDKVVTVSCGDEHTALLTAAGKIYVFGANDWGQLGLGHTLAVNKPTCVKLLKHCKCKYLTCGRTHTLVYTTNNEIYAFGNNNDAQLGPFDKSSYNSPISFNTSALGSIKKIDAGADFSVALTVKGQLYVWGSNAEGQLGIGLDENEVKTPTLLNFEEEIVDVSCGYYHTAFCTKSGKLYTFGENEAKLGMRLSSESAIPCQVDTNSFVTKVECGSSHTVFLAKDGKVYVFGDGSHGQLGLGPHQLQVEEPTCIERLSKHKIVDAYCGDNFTALTTASGKIYTFGDGRHGKLGLGEEDFTNQFKPYRCSQFSKYFVYQASCGGCHLIVLADRRNENNFASSESEMEDPMKLNQSEFNALRTINTDTTTIGNKTIDLGRTLSAREKRRQVRQTNLLSRTLPPLKTIPKLELIAAAKSLPGNDKALTLPLPKARAKKPKETDTISEISEFNKVHILKQDHPGEMATLQPIKPPRKKKITNENIVTDNPEIKDVQLNGNVDNTTIDKVEDLNSSQGEDSADDIGENIPTIEDEKPTLSNGTTDVNEGASTSKVEEYHEDSEEDDEESEYETDDDEVEKPEDDKNKIVKKAESNNTEEKQLEETNQKEEDKKGESNNTKNNSGEENQLDETNPKEEGKGEINNTETTNPNSTPTEPPSAVQPKPKKKWFNFGRGSKKDKQSENNVANNSSEKVIEETTKSSNPQPSGATITQSNTEQAKGSTKPNTKQSKLCNIL